MTNETVSTVEELVAAREARGMSVDDIQRQLKISRRQVDALERGDWAALPGIPFVRGSLRGYARAIGADIEPLLATIGGHGQMAELRAAATLEAPIGSRGLLGFGNGGSGSRWSWAMLALIGIIALALFFGQEGDLPHVPSWLGGGSAATPVVGEATSQTKAADPGSKVGAGGSESVAINPQPATESTAPATASAAARAESTLPAAAASAEPASPPVVRDGVPLKMVFDGDSWVDIKQSNGKSLLYGTQKGQSTSELSTKGAVTLTIGNATQVHVEYDGQPVKLKPAPNSGIAKLTLP
jgi:cytoskeleton protein RodZ